MIIVILFVQSKTNTTITNRQCLMFVIPIINLKNSVVMPIVKS